MGNISHLGCRECHTRYPAERLYFCPKCFGPLDVKYKYNGVKWTRSFFQNAPRNLWRYLDLIDVAKSRECLACGKRRAAEEPKFGVEVEESCARDGRGTFFVTPSQPKAVDLGRLEEALRLRGYQNVKRSLMAFSFDYSSRMRVHILKSGFAVVQVAPPRQEGDRDEAYKVYLDTLDSIKVSQKKVF
jgi:hypothetical protein